MFNWLKKLVTKTGPNAPASPGARHPAADLQPLWDGLATMLKGVDDNGGKGAHAGLGEQLAEFVTTGAPLHVLQSAAKPDLAGHFGLVWQRGETAADATQFFAHLHLAPPELVVRWGKVLATMIAAGPASSPWVLALDQDRRWLEALLLHALDVKANGYSTSDRVTPRGLTAAQLEAALTSDGADPAMLVRAVFATPVERYSYAKRRVQAMMGLPDFDAALHRHREAVRGLLQPAAVEQRVHCLESLQGAQNATLGAFAEALAVHATCGSKQVRVAAEPLVRRAPTAMQEPLRATATTGSPDERQHALRLLHTIAADSTDASLLEFVRSCAAADKAASVRELLVEWDRSQAVAAAPPPARLDVPLPAIDWQVPVTPELAAALDRFWADYLAGVAKHNAEYTKAKAAGRTWLTEWTPLGDADLAALRALLPRAEAPPRHPRREFGARAAADALTRLAETVELSPACVVKLLVFFDLLANGDDLNSFATQVVDAAHARTGRPTLLELHVYGQAAGLAADAVFEACCHSYRRLGRDWPAEHVWPLIAHSLDRVGARLTQSKVDYSFDVEAMYRGIATLPTLPPRLADQLFELALGTGKTERPLAQAALANVPDKVDRIVAALEDGKSEVRAVAANWLRQLRHAPAIPALEAAVGREKHDVTKGALLDALESLGCAIEKYLDRERLAQEARRGLAKGLPKELAWLSLEAMPTVTWRDDGTPVPRDVLAWLCVQASKAKSPEPNVMLRKYTAMFTPATARALAQFVLETWLHEDVAPITPEEAQQLARSAAQGTHDSIRRYPQYHQQDPNRDLSLEELFAKFLPGFLRQPRGSAIASKGVLAVVAACGGEQVTAPVGRYLKEWFGTRAAQGKALIAMLAWIDHPSAIQLMLSVGNRFRTKSFQEEAMKQAQALAERRGWTLDQLADRTMPSAGFDEQGVLELAYGPRTFTAHLHADLSVELRNPEGKKITALPAPRSDDDAEQAKAAKKALSAAKKELKTIAALQTDRLYEAMCTGRDWSVADWTAYLLPHPVVRHLVQRLVWIETGPDGNQRLFRPLDDGTLTDADDEPLQLRDDARVQLAHDSNLAADRIATWQRHLADYEVQPLFQQLGKGSFRLPAEKARATQLDDFVGHLLEAFALRGRAGKLGYVRGPTEDGGWFWTYVKRFPTLGITAVIHFTGNPLPETNRTVALQQLSFRKKLGDREVDLPLGEVPAVLLSECWQDLRLCAAEGTGYAADWEKRSEYR